MEGRIHFLDDSLPQAVLEHTTTQRTNTFKGYRGLTENKKGIEWIFIDEGSHSCSGDSKRIRLRDKYATRPTIYTKWKTCVTHEADHGLII